MLRRGEERGERGRGGVGDINGVKGTQGRENLRKEGGKEEK